MKKFFEPEIEVIKFSTEDVITTSFVEDNDSEEGTDPCNGSFSDRSMYTVISGSQ